MMNALLDIKQLSIGYDKAVVAVNISFQMMPGEVVAVLGLNGAGKSTLLRTLAGLQPSLSGQISINGSAIKSLTANLLARQRSIVLSGRQHVVGELKVRELFEMTNSIRKNENKNETSKSNVLNIIETMHLNELYNRKLSTLSDGEFQRAMIARALVQQTPLVLMDEPTAHLDVIRTMETFKFIQSLPEKFGVGVVFTTHDIEKALHIAHRCIVLDKQSKVQSGTPEELITQKVITSVFSGDAVHFNTDSRRFEYSNQ